MNRNSATPHSSAPPSPARDTQDTPGKPRASGSRQQTQADQELQSGASELDSGSGRGAFPTAPREGRSSQRDWSSRSLHHE